MLGPSIHGTSLSLAIIASLFAAGAMAQTIVDGSGMRLTDEIRQEIFERVTEDFRDPLSSQFRRLHRASKPGRYCGEVNTRNLYGAYGGFKPFLVVLEPEFKSVDVLPEEDIKKENTEEIATKLQAMKDEGCQFGIR